MSKYHGQKNKKQEERDKKKKSEMMAIVASIQGQVQKFMNEIAEKHNAIGKRLEEVYQAAANECGKLWGNQQAFADTNETLDRNVMALSELAKDIYFRLELLDRMAKKIAEKTGIPMEDLMVDLDEARAAAASSYREQVKEAIRAAVEIIRANLEAREARRKEAEEAHAKALEEQKQQEAEAKAALEEAQRAERALRDSEASSVAGIQQSGGPGAAIPEGAQVFGGG